MFIYAILLALPVLALSQPDYSALEAKLFDALDGDKDGKITEAEGVAYFIGYDTDKDGDITEAELKASLDKLDPLFAGHEDALFKLFDRNDSGKVDKADLDTAFKLADSDGDGVISHAEFHVIFQIVVSSVG